MPLTQPCGCGGATAKTSLVVNTADGTAARKAPMPGMPRYRVTGSSEGTKEFATYNEARIFKAHNGGKLRAL